MSVKINQVVLDVLRASCDEKIAMSKERMCDILKRLEAKNVDYFDFGAQVNNIIDNAYELGYRDGMREQQDNK